MKTELTHTPPQFIPVSITITFESKGELDAFGALCNSGLIREALKSIGGNQPSYEVMERAGANVSPYKFEEAINK